MVPLGRRVAAISADEVSVVYLKNVQCSFDLFLCRFDDRNNRIHKAIGDTGAPASDFHRGWHPETIFEFHYFCTFQGGDNVRISSFSLLIMSESASILQSQSVTRSLTVAILAFK